MEELKESIRALKYLMIQARLEHFDELINRGISPRGAYLMILRKSGYI